MNQQVCLFGIDFRTAALDVREKLSLSRAEQLALLPRIAASGSVAEAFLLTTCNRTELYVASAGEPWRDILSEFEQLRPEAAGICAKSMTTVKLGLDAVLHLFGVAAGIESQILGDTNIVTQVKAARDTAAEAGTLGPVLDRALTESLRAAKRARRETAIGRGAASVGAAVLRSIRQSFEGDAPPRVLLLGGGEAGQDVARHLSKARFADMNYAARNPEQSGSLARSFGGLAVDWDSVPHRISGADVVITATAARLDWFTFARFQAITAGRSRALLLVDAGVPRNIDPRCGHQAGVRLLDLDNLARESSEALEARRREIPRVREILRIESGRWAAWWRRRVAMRSAQDDHPMQFAWAGARVALFGKEG